MALEEERFNRVKTSVGYFPYFSIAEILKRNNLKIKDIDFRPKADRTKEPLSEEVKDELTGVDFIPDFDPGDNDN